MALEPDKDTIVAVSTAPGHGAVALIRLSGERALELLRPLASFLPAQVESHRLYFGTLKEQSTNTPVDEVLVAYFKTGHSFTGEEVAEISCHGGHFLAQHIVSLLIQQGARLARRGEFTYRAFMNGRMDLVQAEGVLALIESRSAPAAKLALRQLKGNLSRKMEEILEAVVWTAAHLEANIDFSQEDIEVASVERLLSRLEIAHSQLAQVLAGQQQSRYWRDGYLVALMGCPNVGKSSLLNALLGEERAIVTPLPGTTRDLVEGTLEVRGVRITVTDTAGLRETADPIEKMGVGRARTLSRDADQLFFLSDGEATGESLRELNNLMKLETPQIILVRTKVDLCPELTAEGWREQLQAQAQEENLNRLGSWLSELPLDKFILLSSKTGSGVEKVVDIVDADLASQLIDDAPGTIHERHIEILTKVDESLAKAKGLLRDTASPEFVAFELQVAVEGLHKILGLRFDDQVMDRVFGEFCLGK